MGEKEESQADEANKHMISAPTNVSAAPQIREGQPRTPALNPILRKHQPSEREMQVHSRKYHLTHLNIQLDSSIIDGFREEEQNER